MHRYVIQDGNVYLDKDGILYDVPTPKIGGYKPKNLEQKIAWSVCLNPDYIVKVIIGEVGTGKTMIAVLSALYRLDRGEFHQLIYTRPPAPKQFELGYLPGTESEKLTPWVQAFFDQAELVPKINVERYIREGRIQFLNIERVKGRTFRNSIIIVDETQDCTPETVECLLGRLSEGSETIFIGDPNQVDTRGLSPEYNGLVHLWLINDQPDVAVVELHEPVRSRAAELALLLSKRRKAPI